MSASMGSVLLLDDFRKRDALREELGRVVAELSDRDVVLAVTDVWHALISRTDTLTREGAVGRGIILILDQFCVEPRRYLAELRYGTTSVIGLRSDEVSPVVAYIRHGSPEGDPATISALVASAQRATVSTTA